MKAKILMLGAAATALVPAYAFASTGSGHNSPSAQSQTQTPVAQGQPDQDCEELIASGEGSDPGNSASSGHSAFGGSAGDVYAGSQPQNSKNPASVSQYDVACSTQPQ
jgi:hypothetical protein